MLFILPDKDEIEENRKFYELSKIQKKKNHIYEFSHYKNKNSSSKINKLVKISLQLKFVIQAADKNIEVNNSEPLSFPIFVNNRIPADSYLEFINIQKNIQ